MTNREAMRQLPPLFWFGVILGICGLIDDAIFFFWRHDKPPGNPGGPLASMGGWVVTWEVSGHALVFLGATCVAIASDLLQTKNAERRP